MRLNKKKEKKPNMMALLTNTMDQLNSQFQTYLNELQETGVPKPTQSLMPRGPEQP